MRSCHLIADIGGTNARFALVLADGTIESPEILACADYAGPVEAVRTYLATKKECSITSGAFAIAGPVGHDEIAATNMTWKFSVEATRTALGFNRLDILNDFTAVALSIPHLPAENRHAIGGGTIDTSAPIAVLGAGTGLGVSGLIRSGDKWSALTGEGGHVTACATTDREEAILRVLRQRFGHVSAERLLSGPGIVNIYQAICTLENTPATHTAPDTIGKAALGNSCPLCVETMRIFFAMLGSIAGNLALSLGSFGGVYIAGGIAPRFLDWIPCTDFREKFENKGRLHTFLAKIPTFIVDHPYTAFLGLSHLVRTAGA